MDGSAASARVGAASLGVLGSPAAWRLFAERLERVRARRPVRGGASVRNAEVIVSGQLALAVSEERVVAAAVWETLPAEVQREVTVRLARLLARLVEAERDE